MPKRRIDSSIAEYNEDGSVTVTTIETHIPATKAEQPTAWAALGLMSVIAVAPLGYAFANEKIEEKRERRRKAKLNVVKDD